MESDDDLFHAIFEALGSISGTFDACQSAYGVEGVDKVSMLRARRVSTFPDSMSPTLDTQTVSSASKKRLAARALQGLRNGGQTLQVGDATRGQGQFGSARWC